MPIANRRVRSFLAASALFLAGTVVGTLVTRSVSALNKFGQPKTVIHTVAYKFRPTTSLNDQQQIIAGAKESFIHGQHWAFASGLIAVVVGAVLVTFFFPHAKDEKELLASYQRQDAARPDMTPTPRAVRS